MAVVAINAGFTELVGALQYAVPAAVVLDVLRYHVVEGRRAAVGVVPKGGERRLVPLMGDISARNGIIHVIDELLVPPSVVAVLTN